MGVSAIGYLLKVDCKHIMVEVVSCIVSIHAAQGELSDLFSVYVVWIWIDQYQLIGWALHVRKVVPCKIVYVIKTIPYTRILHLEILRGLKIYRPFIPHDLSQRIVEIQSSAHYTHSLN